jgi:hypothetical protein
LREGIDAMLSGDLDNAFNGDALRDLAGQYLALAEKQKATFLLVTGHVLMGVSL